jgi:DNA-binding PadR family transcriptional regulator
MASGISTTLGYAILGLLHQQPRSGYDLRKLFETTPMAHYSGSPGAIYPALRKLAKQSLIEGKVDSSKPLRPREVFRPTRAGTAAFRSWLRAGVQRDDVVWRVEELTLRFAFHSHLDDVDATKTFLEDFLRETESYVGELRLQLKQMSELTPIQGRMALECGIELYKARARWARKSLAHFAE